MHCLYLSFAVYCFIIFSLCKEIEKRLYHSRVSEVKWIQNMPRAALTYWALHSNQKHLLKPVFFSRFLFFFFVCAVHDFVCHSQVALELYTVGNVVCFN